MSDGASAGPEAKSPRDRSCRPKAFQFFLVEEHREAYCVFAYAVKSGVISSSGNFLLHVDDHHDLALPVLCSEADICRQSMSDILACTFEQLRVCDFLVPLVHQGIFSEIYWLRREGLHQRSVALETHVERSGKRFYYYSRPMRQQDAGASNHRAVLHTLTPNTILTIPNPVVLDIDLDYFSCCDTTGEACRIEITANEYHEFLANKRHPWKAMFGSRAKVARKGGRYFLAHNEFDGPPLRRSQTNAQIRKSVAEFRDFLSRSGVVPAFGIISRSRHSGFTPPKQVAYIERTLLSLLAEVMNFTVIHIDVLLNQLGCSMSCERS